MTCPASDCDGNGVTTPHCNWVVSRNVVPAWPEAIRFQGEDDLLFAPDVVIPILKIAVATVTVVLIASLIALALGNKRLHGRLNVVFFTLTMTAVLGLEIIIRFVNPDFTSGFSPDDRRSLLIHLCFAIPAAVVLPLMLYSGKTHKPWHVTLSILFSALWIGTFVTGIFFLPYPISRL